MQSIFCLYYIQLRIAIQRIMPEGDKKAAEGEKRGRGRPPKDGSEAKIKGVNKTPGYVPTGNPRGRPKKTE